MLDVFCMTIGLLIVATIFLIGIFTLFLQLKKNILIYYRLDSCVCFRSFLDCHMSFKSFKSSQCCRRFKRKSNRSL